MSATNRRFELLNLVRSQGRLEVTSATSVLGVSHETIRRDLRLLESQGLISRTYGVAHPIESGAFESSLAFRAEVNPEEKRRIAVAAAERLGEARIIFIDEGFTTQLIANALPEREQLTVVTASIPVATLLAARPNVQVIMLGGRVRGNTLGVVDQWAAEQLGRLVIDVAFIGANGVTLDRGMTTPDPAVALVKSAAMKASQRRIFIGAHHKFGQSTFVRFADITDFELMITGRELPQTIARPYLEAGVSLVRV
jgi:DeoR family transcriptional regulator, fructose operon transcriptional repressor